MGSRSLKSKHKTWSQHILFLISIQVISIENGEEVLLFHEYFNDIRFYNEGT